MAPQSMLTLFWAFIVACLFGVTYAYPSNIQEILEHQNGENTAQIAKILSHFSPDTDQDDSKDLEVRISALCKKLPHASWYRDLVRSHQLPRERQLCSYKQKRNSEQSQKPSSCGFVSLIEQHIETHIEDSFSVSFGCVCLNETHSEE